MDAADVDNEDWRETFTYLHGRYEVLAPDLVASEAGNVVHHKAPEAFGVDREERSRVLEVLLSGIDLVSLDEEDRERSGDHAEQAGLTFYDARFLALADGTEDGVLLTHDAELAEAAREHLGGERCLTLDEAGQRIVEGEL